jgi:hypothetical protein
MTQSLFNWCQDLEMALQNGGEHDPELRTARLEMAAEWLRRFPGEDGLITGNFRRALAGSYFETGHQQKADELYRSWLDDDPPGDGDGSAGPTVTHLTVPAGHRTTRGRKRSCAVATPLPEYGKASTSRDGWRTSAPGPAVPPRPGSSGSTWKRAGSVPGGG